MPTPLCQGRRIQAFASQEGPDLPWASTSLCLFDNAGLVRRREPSSLGLGRDLRVGGGRTGGRVVGPSVRRRVGTGDCSPAPLTEPDLWAAHPALQVAISCLEQQKLSARGPYRRIELPPSCPQGKQSVGKPGIAISASNPREIAPLPDTPPTKGCPCGSFGGDTTRYQVTVQVTWTFLLMNDDRT